MLEEWALLTLGLSSSESIRTQLDSALEEPSEHPHHQVLSQTVTATAVSPDSAPSV